MMRLDPRILFGTALAVLLAVTALAQDSGPQTERRRRPTFVRVVDAGGEAVAGATVTFAGGSPHLVEDVLPVDVQRVLSDGRGRARARLLPGLCYVAWAAGPLGEDDFQEIAQPHGYFGAGALFELTTRRQNALRLQLTGTDAWSDYGPLRYYLVTPHPGVAQELERAADGSLILPALSPAAFEVRGSDDQPLWHEPVQRTLDMPPPVSVRVQVQDERGAPIAGARIRQRVGRRPSWRFDAAGGVVEARMRDLGQTDADGRATVAVPYDSDPLREPGMAEMMLFVDAPGRALTAGGIYGRRRYINDRRVEEFAGTELADKELADKELADKELADTELADTGLTFVLQQAEPIVVPPGIVPAGASAQLATICKLRSRGNGYMHDARIFTANAGEDGQLTFDHVPADLHSLRACVVLDSGVPCVFEGLLGRNAPPELMIEPASPLTDRLGSIRVRCFDPSGGPAGGAVVTVVPAESRGVTHRDSMFRFPVDSAGRGSLRVAPGPWVAIVITNKGYRASAFEVGTAPEEVELRMEPLATMSVVLRDRDGNPVSGARLRIAGSQTRAIADPRQSIMRQFSRQMRKRWSGLETGADGSLVIPFLPVAGVTWNVSLHWPGGSTEKFVIEANTVPGPLRPK